VEERGWYCRRLRYRYHATLLYRKEINYTTKLFKKSNLQIVYTSNNSDQHLLRLKTGAGYEKKFHRSVLYELTCLTMLGLRKEIHRQNWQELKKTSLIRKQQQQ